MTGCPAFGRAYAGPLKGINPPRETRCLIVRLCREALQDNLCSRESANLLIWRAAMTPFVAQAEVHSILLSPVRAPAKWLQAIPNEPDIRLLRLSKSCAARSNQEVNMHPLGHWRTLCSIPSFPSTRRRFSFVMVFCWFTATLLAASARMPVSALRIVRFVDANSVEIGSGGHTTVLHKGECLGPWTLLDIVNATARHGPPTPSWKISNIRMDTWRLSTRRASPGIFEIDRVHHR